MENLLGFGERGMFKKKSYKESPKFKLHIKNSGVFYANNIFKLFLLVLINSYKTSIHNTLEYYDR